MLKNLPGLKKQILLHFIPTIPIGFKFLIK